MLSLSEVINNGNFVQELGQENAQVDKSRTGEEMEAESKGKATLCHRLGFNFYLRKGNCRPLHRTDR